MKRIVSERGVNKHFIPMIGAKGKTFDKDVVINDDDGNVITIIDKDSRWNLNCYKMIDYISTTIRSRFNLICMNNKKIKRILKYAKDPMVSELCPMLTDISFIHKITNDSELFNVSFPFTYEEMRESIILKNMRKDQIIGSLKKISSYRIKTKYHIRCEDIHGNHHFKLFYSNLDSESDRLFDFNYKNIVTLDKSIKAIPHLNFNSPLGTCFLHNIYTNSYELINPKMYELSKYSQILYRMKFISNNLNVKIYFNLTKPLLGFTNTNFTESMNNFKKIVYEMKDFGLIEIIKFCKVRKMFECKRSKL